MQKSKTFLPMLIPTVTVFISSGCIMVIELVASRLIARHLGSSLYTWTSVIGVVLAGITIGNYAGGRIADKFQPRKSLAILFLLASIACVAIVALTNIIGDWLWLWKLNWPTHVFTHITLVFLLPSVLLGTISPVVAKMALDKGLATGRTVGDIYAWGAAGSIAGTFLAGFYLIAAMGTVAIIWSVAALLAVMAVLYRAKFWPLYIWVIILAVLIFGVFSGSAKADDIAISLSLKEKPDPHILYEDETQYCYVAVRQTSEKPDKRVFMQDKLTHSKISMDDITDLQYFYTHIYAGITQGLAGEKEKLTTLTIGGGGYAFPQYIQKKWPDSQIDVAEIDPGVTEAAMAGFGLSRDTTINTITMDARNYVDGLLHSQGRGEEIPKYDFIYEDAINDYTVPCQLVTKEFNERISKILAEDGVYMVNLIDIFESGRFLGAIVNTLEETFPYVYVITRKHEIRTGRDTFVVICSQKQIDTKKFMEDYQKNLREKPDLWYLGEPDMAQLRTSSKGLVLTDDYVPAENLLANVVRESAKDALASKYAKRGNDYKKRQEFRESIRYLQLAINEDETLTTRFCNDIGIMYSALGESAAAIEAFQQSIEYNKRTNNRSKVGSIHFNIGAILQQMNRPQEAKSQFLKAIEALKEELAESADSPDAHEICRRLGDTYATIGDFKSASEVFRRALALNPTNAEYYDNLVVSLEYQGRYKEAINVLKKQIALMKRAGYTTNVVDLQQKIKRLEYQMSQKK